MNCYLQSPCTSRILFHSGDFDAGIRNLTFNLGSTSEMLTVAITEDTIIEETEQFSITLQSPSFGSVDPTAGSATVFITDNESKTGNNAA
jgi:hypothetical protein